MSDEKRKQARDFGDGFRAGYLAALEDAAKACEERSVVYDGLESTASTLYFADKMRGAREGAESCAAAVLALGE